MIAMIVVVALALPHFGVVLNLIGATTIAAANFVFPPLFYLLLSRQNSRRDGYEATEDRRKESESEEARLLLHQSSDSSLPKASTEVVDERWVNFEIFVVMLIGIIGGIASFYSALRSLIYGVSSFTAPCFSNWAVADTP